MIFCCLFHRGHTSTKHLACPGSAMGRFATVMLCCMQCMLSVCMLLQGRESHAPIQTKIFRVSELKVPGTSISHTSWGPTQIWRWTSDKTEMNTGGLLFPVSHHGLLAPAASFKWHKSGCKEHVELWYREQKRVNWMFCCLLPNELPRPSC